MPTPRPFLAAVAAAAVAVLPAACGDDDVSPTGTTEPAGVDEGDLPAPAPTVDDEGVQDQELPPEDPTGRTETTVEARPTPQEDTDRGDDTVTGGDAGNGGPP